MVMSWIFTFIVLAATVCALFTGNGAALATAIPAGAQSGVTLALSMAGSIILWSAVGKVMDEGGITALLSKLLRPILCKLFPSSKQDSALSNHLSANICANFLGLGNAATPMGILAAKRMATGKTASNELCRLIVLNTASIQLVPTTVAAIRSSLGCSTPFDILPAVWITSIASVTAGLCAAWLLGKVWPQ